MANIQLYHYTTREGADSIRSEKKIRGSTADGYDAAFGSGVYFTTLDPYNTKEDIALNNWTSTRGAREGKVDYVIVVTFLKDDDGPTKEKDDSGRDIYLYRGNVLLNRDDIEYEIRKV